MESKVITASDIERYLSDRDDFDLELYVLRSLRHRGWNAQLGGSYIDSVTGKARQFDIRTHNPITNYFDFFAAIECKSLSREAPLVVSRIPRPPQEAGHCLIKRWHSQRLGAMFQVDTSISSEPSIYPAGEMVGKSTSQIRCGDGKKRPLSSSDGDAYEKWSQSLSSANDLIQTAATMKSSNIDFHISFIMPALVVNDETLWVVDYDDEGRRASPVQVNEALLYVDRSHQVKNSFCHGKYLVSHLHVFTRTGLTEMIDSYAGEGAKAINSTFGFGMSRAASEQLMR